MTAGGRVCALGIRRVRDESGTSILEIVVTLGVVILVVGLSALSLNRTFADLGTASQGFINDLRQARLYAVTRGVHYRLSWTSTAYTLIRLQDSDQDGDWDVDGQVDPQTVNLPLGVSMATVGEGGALPQAVEFDTRGMVVPDLDQTLGVVRVAISKTERPSGTVQVEIWPSGQVNPAS